MENKQKETRNQITIEIKPSIFDYSGTIRGRLIYYYSARRKVEFNDFKAKKELTDAGFYHVKKQSMGKKLIFVKNAKIILEVSKRTAFGEKVYKEDITKNAKAYIGEISPTAAEKLAHKINKERKIKPVLIEGRVYLLSKSFY